MTHVTVSEIARRLGCRPRDVSDLFYRRALRDDIAPVVGGRRIVPLTYLGEIERALNRTGRRRSA